MATSTQVSFNHVLIFSDGPHAGLRAGLCACVVLQLALCRKKIRAKLSPRALALHTSAPGKVTAIAIPFRT